MGWEGRGGAAGGRGRRGSRVGRGEGEVTGGRRTVGGHGWQGREGGRGAEGRGGHGGRGRRGSLLGRAAGRVSRREEDGVGAAGWQGRRGSGLGAVPATPRPLELPPLAPTRSWEATRGRSTALLGPSACSSLPQQRSPKRPVWAWPALHRPPVGGSPHFRCPAAAPPLGCSSRAPPSAGLAQPQATEPNPVCKTFPRRCPLGARPSPWAPRSLRGPLSEPLWRGGSPEAFAGTPVSIPKAAGLHSPRGWAGRSGAVTHQPGPHPGQRQGPGLGPLALLLAWAADLHVGWAWPSSSGDFGLISLWSTNVPRAP